MTAIGEVARKDGGIRLVLNMLSSHRLVSRMPRFLLVGLLGPEPIPSKFKTCNKQYTSQDSVTCLTCNVPLSLVTCVSVMCSQTLDCCSIKTLLEVFKRCTALVMGVMSVGYINPSRYTVLKQLKVI